MKKKPASTAEIRKKLKRAVAKAALAHEKAAKEAAKQASKLAEVARASEEHGAALALEKVAESHLEAPEVVKKHWWNWQ